jgi:hypothetical protein
MNLKRYSIIMAFALIALLFQFAPTRIVDGVAAAATRCNWIGFIADGNVPDGTTFKPGESFQKFWRLRNIGSCPWKEDYKLVFESGDLLGAPASVRLAISVAPGQELDISLPMSAPALPGHYRGYWIFTDSNGVKFGMGPNADKPFWVDINAVADLPTAYDFATNICAATWRNEAGVLPCPGTDGDSRGFALKLSKYKTEDGTEYSLPGLLLFPENRYYGQIQGTYPEFTVQSGDRFQSVVGCVFNSSCYVTFRLDYQEGNGPLKVFWRWTEKSDDRTYRVNLDLSPLAGKTVKFSLTLQATGSPAGDRAILAMPYIARAGGSTGSTATVTQTVTATATGPTPVLSTTGTVTPTPSVSATPIPPTLPDVYYDFGSNACAASWKSGAGALPCPGADGDSRGFVLPVSNPQYENGATDSSSSLILFPQNKYNGYIQGTYPEMTIQAGDRFQSIVNCAYGSSCYVTFRLEYQIGNGPQTILWTWKEKNEGQFYRLDRDLSALAGKKVRFTLTILATGSATGDRALWAQPRLIRLGGNASSTPTLTATPEPPKVTSASVEVAKPFSIACGGPNPIDVFGSITTNNPMNVIYHWELGGDKTEVSADQVLSFNSAGTIPIHAGTYLLDCGSYTARLVATSPNSYSALIYFTVAQTNALISATPTQTPFLSCTAPACSAGALTCGNPNGCPGGCGTICITFTPTVTATITPMPPTTPTSTVTATLAGP